MVDQGSQARVSAFQWVKAVHLTEPPHLKRMRTDLWHVDVMQVATMTVCFFVNFGVSPPPSVEVAKGFIPVVCTVTR
jgi:hypothetical protein